MWLLALGKKTDCGASWGVLVDAGSSEGLMANKPVLLPIDNSGFGFGSIRATVLLPCSPIEGRRMRCSCLLRHARSNPALPERSSRQIAAVLL